MVGKQQSQPLCQMKLISHLRWGERQGETIEDMDIVTSDL